ncbi:hypothetical protein TARUN_3689 [Trichoderma arundinaceum]|uniref:Uncharacterized protein n=1 Tax=Trichoderma arundinaceum TaxID=490622 RepID=A0A395NRA3_TRIAR|nr:hypothetical protein TARUN_3689 [Trichoderma arundinaceum]
MLSLGHSILASVLPFAIHRFTIRTTFLTNSAGNITGQSSITASHHSTTIALSRAAPSESRYHSGIHRPSFPLPLMHRMQMTPKSSHPAMEIGMSTLTIALGSYGVPS